MINPSEELKVARRRANMSRRRLAKSAGRPVSTVARIELGLMTPTVVLFDDLLARCGSELVVKSLEDESMTEGVDPAGEPITGEPARRPKKHDSHVEVRPPETYPNPRGDDAWDNDAIHYLLTKEDVSATFKRGPLTECLRRQPNRLQNQPHRVDEAAALARRYGVVQRPLYDPKIGKTVVRLIRTDDDAPTYPADRIVE